MNIPNNAGVGGGERNTRGGLLQRNTVWRCLEFVTGGAITVLFIWLSYSVLIDLTHPLGPLSPTMVMFIIIFTWVILWGLVAAAREHFTSATN